MELTLWTYEGPPHVGAMRIASSMKDIHYVLHAPQGDTYADLLFTMIERRGQRPPVTYTTFQARDLGGDTAELVKKNIKEAVERFKPKTLLVGESCTAELIQDQPGALAKGMGFDMPIVNLELPAYSKKENWGASETFYQLTRTLLKEKVSSSEKISPLRWKELGRRPKVNILGPSLLGFRCRDDVIEIQRILSEQGIDTNVVAPLGASPEDIERLKNIQLDLHKDFIDVVEKSRGSKLNKSEVELFSGEFWSGSKAKNLGLIDGIGNAHEILKEKFGDDVTIKKFEKSKGWLSQKLSSSSNQVDQIASILDERSIWQRYGF